MHVYVIMLVLCDSVPECEQGVHLCVCVYVCASVCMRVCVRFCCKGVRTDKTTMAAAHSLAAGIIGLLGFSFPYDIFIEHEYANGMPCVMCVRVRVCGYDWSHFAVLATQDHLMEYAMAIESAQIYGYSNAGCTCCICCCCTTDIHYIIRCSSIP